MSLDSASIVPPKQREENYENCTKFFNRIWRFGRALETCSISFSKRYNRNVQVCDDPRKGEPLIFTPSVPFLTCILTCISKTFPETEAITAHIPLGTHFPSQTKIPEKPGAKPLFGDFTLELLIRFERTTCSLRAIKGTFNVLCRVVSLSNKLRDAIILFVRCCIVQSR